ncbi:MAG: hypothetical protein DHS20C11_02670 [Lysobacteraceae bacterium]|nr:MAG: hypothetical protein DHS20C11_02670 [Xanthomonadaceae bacterium]
MKRCLQQGASAFDAKVNAPNRWANLLLLASLVHPTLSVSRPVDVDVIELTPGQRVEISVSGVSPCLENISPRPSNATASEAGYVFGNTTANLFTDVGCTFSTTTYSYQLTTLNWPASAPLPAEMTLQFERGEGQAPLEVQAMANEPALSTTFLYVGDAEDSAIHVIRTDSLQTAKTVRVPSGTIKANDTNSPDSIYFQHQRELDDGHGGRTVTSLGHFNPLIADFVAQDFLATFDPDFLKQGEIRYISGNWEDSSPITTPHELRVSGPGGYIDHYFETPTGQLAAGSDRVFLTLPDDDKVVVLSEYAIHSMISIAGGPFSAHQSRSGDMVMFGLRNGRVALVNPYSLEVTQSPNEGAPIQRFTESVSGQLFGLGTDERVYTINPVSASTEPIPGIESVIGVSADWESDDLFVLTDSVAGSRLLKLEARTLKILEVKELEFRAQGIANYSSIRFVSAAPSRSQPVGIPTLSWLTVCLLSLLLAWSTVVVSKRQV